MTLLLKNVIYNGGQKCWDLFSDIREFKQIATATSTTAVMDAVSWGEYVS